MSLIGKRANADRIEAEKHALSIRAYWAHQGVTVQTWLEWVEGPNKKQGAWTIKSEGIPTKGGTL